MFKILDNIYIWVFLVNIESVLFLALVRYMLCSRFTQNCILLYILEAKNPYFVTKNCWKSSYICVFVLSKNGTIDFTKTLTTQERLVVESCPTPRWIPFFNTLSIGVQYKLSFQWTNFGLKCLFIGSRFSGIPKTTWSKQSFPAT